MNGALLFAQNNSVVDYIKLAEFAASRITKFLDVPVSLATDTPDAVSSSVFDKVIQLPNASYYGDKTFRDGAIEHKKVEWKNLSRSSAYDLTPYNKTLVIDTDYIINSSVLKPAFDRDYDFQIYKNSFPLNSMRDDSEFKRINQYSIPFYWATTFIFEKNEITKTFFELITYIKINWIYFKHLYSLNSSMYRNDFAFSIAIHMMNNMTNGDFAIELPGTMSYITDKDILIKMQDTSMQFLLQKAQHIDEYIAAKTCNLDMHVMNKLSLLRVIDNV